MGFCSLHQWDDCQCRNRAVPKAGAQTRRSKQKAAQAGLNVWLPGSEPGTLCSRCSGRVCLGQESRTALLWLFNLQSRSLSQPRLGNKDRPPWISDSHIEFLVSIRKRLLTAEGAAASERDLEKQQNHRTRCVLLS